jgi:hypothetical protein
MTGRSRMHDETLERMLETGYRCGTQRAPLTQERKERVAAGDFYRWETDRAKCLIVLERAGSWLPGALIPGGWDGYLPVLLPGRLLQLGRR